MAAAADRGQRSQKGQQSWGSSPARQDRPRGHRRVTVAGLGFPHAITHPDPPLDKDTGQHKAAGGALPSLPPPRPRSGRPPAGSYLRGSAPASFLLPPCPGRCSGLARLAAPAADTTPTEGWDRPPATSSRARPGQAPPPPPAPAPARPAHPQPADGLAVLPPQQRQLLPQLQDTTHQAEACTAAPAAPGPARSRPGPRTFSFWAPLRAPPPAVSSADPSVAAGSSMAASPRNRAARGRCVPIATGPP